MNKSLNRHALMLASGQQFLMNKSASSKTRKVLWYYDWGTIGDSIMDLSQRFQIPSNVSIDLCMPHGPISLFTNDTRFRRVHKSISECDRQYDLIILQNLTTKTLFQKIRHYPFTRFYSIMGHKRNEDFSRMQLSYERLSGLFGLERASGPIEPSIGLTSVNSPKTETFQIAVAVGGNDQRRRFENWPSVIRLIDNHWPKSQPKPTYIIVGAGEHAKEAAARICGELPSDRVVSRLDLPTVEMAAEIIQESSFFIGADGGLMHIAAALRKHGVGLFSEILPEWRLHSESKMGAIFTSGDINEIGTERIGHEVIGHCQTLFG